MEAYVARQPLYNRSMKLVGYELLYRDSVTNAFPIGVSALEATSKLINDTHFTLGIKALTHNRIALINFSEEAILQRLPLMMNPKEVIIEVLETATPSDDLYECLKELHDKGYVIALDDFVYSPEWTRFIKISSILKIDVQKTPVSTLQKFIKVIRTRLPDVRLLAEKVETKEEYEEAKKLGFTFFQGYLFGKPKVEILKTIQPQMHTILETFKIVTSEDPNIDELVKYVSQDTALVYKLLRYINSGIFGQDSPIKSVRGAINYIGIARMKKFIALQLTCCVGEDQPEDIVLSTLTRARTSESIALEPRVKAHKEQAFFTGLLSNMDKILGVPMAMILKQINVEKTIELALQGTNNELTPESRVLKNLLSLVVFNEAGNWYQTQKFAELVDVDPSVIPKHYRDAVEWVDDFVSASQLIDDDHEISVETTVKQRRAEAA